MKSKLKLVEYPNESLSEPSSPIEINTASTDFAMELKTFYHQLRGEYGTGVVGLAAPQVGKNVRMFIAEGEVYINPEILWTPKKGVSIQHEGCLSLPKMEFFQISRPYSVKLKWQDLTGEYHEQRFNDFLARVILHEMDHLDGKLCNAQ